MRRYVGEVRAEEILGIRRRSGSNRGRWRRAEERGEGRRSSAVGNERDWRRGRGFGSGILRRRRLPLRVLDVGGRMVLIGVDVGVGVLAGAGRQLVVVVGDHGVVDGEVCREGRPRAGRAGSVTGGLRR